MSNNKLRYLSAITRLLLQVVHPYNAPTIKYHTDSSVNVNYSYLLRGKNKKIRRPNDFPTYSELTETLVMLGMTVQGYWDGQSETIKYHGTMIGTIADVSKD